MTIPDNKKWLMIVVKALVFVDFFAVALVVPLISNYFRDAGTDSSLYGLITSLYFISQLAGELIHSSLSDYTSKKSVLILSFVGSGISYLLVGTTKNIPLLFFSRILVGLTKQTMNISTLIISDITHSIPEERSKQLAHISALASASFIVGPSLGGIIFKYNTMLPSILSAVLFGMNIILCIVFLPAKEIAAADMRQKLESSSGSLKNSSNGEKTDRIVNKSSLKSMIDNGYDQLQVFLDYSISHGILGIIIMRVLIFFVQSATSSRHVLNYYQDRFGIETYQLGFLTSFSMILGMLSQFFLVGPVSSYFKNNDYLVIVIALTGLVITSVLESVCPDFYSFLILSQLPSAISGALLGSSTKAIFLNAIPQGHTGKVMGIFNIMNNGISIISPMYGGYIMTRNKDVQYKGFVASAHYLVVAIVTIVLKPYIDIKSDSKKSDEIESTKLKTDDESETLTDVDSNGSKKYDNVKIIDDDKKKSSVSVDGKVDKKNQ